jgi:hypothetical protein
MSTYKNLIGKDVNFLSTDPDNAEAEGQIWYNSTSGTFKSVVASSAWVSSTPLPIATSQSGGAGVNTASLVFGGSSPANNAEDATYEYNGSGYTNSGDLNTSRTGISGAGTQTAALGAGGYLFPGGSNHTETYNGTSWTAVTAMPSANSYCSCGTQTAAIYVTSSTTLEYSSPSWSSGGGLNTPRAEASMAGTQTANIFFGGGPQTSASSASEEYDGTSFTNSATMNTARGIQIGGSGVQTSALAYGGAGPAEPNRSAATESFNGTSWSTEGSLGTVTSQMQKGGSTSSNSSSAISAGGNAPSRSSKTEEYSVSINTITAAAWASGGTLPGSGRQGYGVGTGTQTASIIAGGPPTSTQNQFYDGSSWTNLAAIPTGVTDSQGFGDTEELLMAGGGTAEPYASSTYVYSRPGDSWTAVSSPGNLNTGRALGAGCGALSTAGIISGGTTDNSPLVFSNATESWNGSTWTSVNNLPTATGQGMGSCGTQTAGLAWSGQNPGDPTAEETYEWDGTNWTSGGNRSTGVRAVRGGAGTATAALTFGGWLDPGGSTATEGYDGTAWSTRPNMAGSAANNFSTGTQTAALRAGGTDGPGYTAVEEFTGETTAVNAKTITTS